MNDYLAAAIIGVVEGLTEFLPVSSTAHIRWTQMLLDLPAEDEYWKMFSVVIQLGAILAVVCYFQKRLREFVVDFFRRPDGAAPTMRQRLGHPLVLILVAFVVTAIPCYLIDKQIGEWLEKPRLMAWALLLGGIAMWVVDAIFSRRATTERLEQVRLWQALVIGAAQILAAAFPGVSRSMATIAGGQVVGLQRAAALEFSFLLSIPVMLAATSFKLLQYQLESTAGLTGHQWVVLAIGFATSFIVALAVIAWFMQWVRQRGFAPFAIYRIVAGAALLAWLR